MKSFPKRNLYRQKMLLKNTGRPTKGRSSVFRLPLWNTLLTAAISGALAYAVVKVQEKIADKDRNVHFLEYSNKLLTLPVNDKREIRKFAVDIIGVSAPVGLSTEARDEFMSFQMPLSLVSPSNYRPNTVERLYDTDFNAPRSGRTHSDAAPSPSPSAPQELKFGTVSMPSDVEEMYVFYQDPEQKNADGCAEKRIDPHDFPSKLPEYISTAKKLGRDLVITARSKSIAWGAIHQIHIDGIGIQFDYQYYCDNWKRGGGKLII